jgi:hypothetical protein
MSSETATANITTAEMEETIARISSHKGVEGVMIMNRQGVYARLLQLELLPCSNNLIIFYHLICCINLMACILSLHAFL